jgi:hypothetical protein
MTGVISKMAARNGTTGKIIEEKIARREPPTRRERNAPSVPTNEGAKKKIDHFLDNGKRG